MTETPVSMTCFNESKIKRVIIDMALSLDELKKITESGLEPA